MQLARTVSSLKEQTCYDLSLWWWFFPCRLSTLKRLFYFLGIAWFAGEKQFAETTSQPTRGGEEYHNGAIEEED